MAIIQPSQYDCDLMEPGDIILIKSRNFLYKWYRKHFQKYKNKIKVIKDWDHPKEFVEYYQEDCSLLYYYDTQCIKKYDNIVPCMVSNDPTLISKNTFYLKSLQIGLYNIQIILPNNKTFTIPTSYFEYGIKYNEDMFNQIENSKAIKRALKYSILQKEDFLEIIERDNMQCWIPSYCSICGKPVIFNFKEDKVVIDNRCSCGILKLKAKELTYDQFVLWYQTQNDPKVKELYDKFWFNKEK